MNSTSNPESKLAEMRSNKGVTLERIHAETKIGLYHLKAIENREYHKLPGGLYNVSYMRQYAAVAGLDESAVLDPYRDFLQQTA
jgi:cytoskeletal protein RodZ